MPQTSTTSDLLRCPKNLQECIDWVICIENQSKTAKLAEALKSLVATVELDPIASGLVKLLEGIKGTGGSPKYASSYNPSEATWPVCGSTKQCSGCQNSSCHSGPSPQSCDGKCCEDCDVRKAAKIFLGILPCLYYALKYLKEKCEKDWKTFNISNKDASLRYFLVGMGYDLGQLESKKGQKNFDSLKSLINGSDGSLQKLYIDSKNYFPSPSLVPSPKPKSQPKTVRSMLLWLSGLPFTSGFEALLQHCERLCDSTQGSVKPENFKASLFDSCFLSPFVLGAMEDSKSDALKGFPPYKSEILKFSYPEDPFELLERLCEYVRKIFLALKFLYLQCKNDRDKAGWGDCYFGRNCSVNSTSGSSSGCGCDGSKTYLCNSSGHSNSCSSGSCKSQCPHPLQRFLTGIFPFHIRDSSVPLMGFSQQKLPTPAHSGWSLYYVLDAFCRNGFYPLTRLLKFLTCISRSPPETLGELFAFFQMFAGALNSEPLKDFVPWVNGEPGWYDGDSLKTALEDLNGSEDSHWDGKPKTHKNSTESAPADLYSLSYCDGPKGSSSPTCGPYLYPLIQGASDIFGDDFIQTYLSWICYLTPKFKTLLEKFKQKFSSCSHCSSSCQNIVKCPCALPLMYSYGFTFWSPKTLNSGEKSCANFVAQLKKVLEGSTPLSKLLSKIEKFIWHIRLPFFFGFLYVWFFVLSYFCYAILIKLDAVHTGSHLHLPRTFKILPSTLFSDASSKLKDLSYFTL